MAKGPLAAAVLRLAFLVALTAACSHHRPVAPAPPRDTDQPEANAQRIIARADESLRSGMKLVGEGNLTLARAELDRAIEAYLTAPGGAYHNPALAEAYGRTLDTIYRRELEAIAAGGGSADVPSDPAAIDEDGARGVSDEPVSEQARQTAEAAARDEHNDLPIALNDAVVSCIELYQGPLRDWFTSALVRGGRYLPEIRATFEAEGIPQDLAYVALVESAFQTGALSRARAKGVWQFIPETGRRYGLRQDRWVDERSNPEKASRAAARYLKALFEILGDWNLALAGYNTGEGRVLRGMGRYGTRDYWALRKTRALTRETKDYVPMVHAAIIVAKAPERYGFAIEQEQAEAYETVPLRAAVDLRTVSQCLEASLDTVRAINPELRGLVTPSRGFNLKVPRGAGLTLIECLEKRRTVRGRSRGLSSRTSGGGRVR